MVLYSSIINCGGTLRCVRFSLRLRIPRICNVTVSFPLIHRFLSPARAREIPSRTSAGSLKLSETLAEERDERCDQQISKLLRHFSLRGSNYRAFIVLCINIREAFVRSELDSRWTSPRQSGIFGSPDHTDLLYLLQSLVPPGCKIVSLR